MVELGAPSFPSPLTALCAVLLAVAVACAVFVAFDVVRHPPQMRVMALVWPLTMLFGSVVWLVFYLRRGRATAADHGRWAGTAIDTSHCGAGCALGDLLGEFRPRLVPRDRDPCRARLAVPGTAWSPGGSWTSCSRTCSASASSTSPSPPMRGLGVRAGLVAALKADTLSIVAWQIGMYGLMAVWQLAVFPALFGGRRVSSPRVLGGDAARDGGRLRVRVPGERLAGPPRHQGCDVTAARMGSMADLDEVLAASRGLLGVVARSLTSALEHVTVAAVPPHRPRHDARPDACR